MSRPKKPWFRKSNKRWYVWFDGKQVNLGPDKKQAHQQFHELMAQPAERQVVRRGKISLPELVDHFLDWVQRNRAPDTYEWYRYRLERLCRAHPNMAAERLKPYEVEAWVNGYDHLSVTSRRNYFRSAKRCYGWGVKQGHLQVNPIASIEVPRAESREVALTQDEFDNVMTYVRNPSLADLMTVTWLTGCRPQESLIVEAADVDLVNQRWVLQVSRSKGKRFSRVVYMTDEVVSIVRRLMSEYPEGPLFRNSKGLPWTKDAINCAFGAIQTRMGKDKLAREGSCVSEKEIKKLIRTLRPTRTSSGREVEKSAAELRAEAKRKAIQRYVSKSVPRNSLYALRHSFATNALRKGVDSLTVAVLLGHKDPSTLARVYQHLNQSPGHLLDQARRAAG